MPADDPSQLDSIDKVIHFVAYFIMAVLALFAFRSNAGRIIALSITFGIGINKQQKRESWFLIYQKKIFNKLLPVTVTTADSLRLWLLKVRDRTALISLTA